MHTSAEVAGCAATGSVLLALDAASLENYKTKKPLHRSPGCSRRDAETIDHPAWRGPLLPPPRFGHPRSRSVVRLVRGREARYRFLPGNRISAVRPRSRTLNRDIYEH